MLNLRKSSPKPGVWSSSSHAGESVEVKGEETGLATVLEGTWEFPLEAVVVDVDVVLRSI